MKKLLVEWPPRWWFIDMKHDIVGFFECYVDEIKYFFHRGLYGYSSKEFWNGDAYLSYVIVELCHYIRDHGKGVPNDFVKLCDDDVDKGALEWKNYLDRIAYGFNLYLENERYCLSSKFDHIVKSRLHESFVLLENQFESLWD